MKLIVKDKKRKTVSSTQKEKGRFFKSFHLYSLCSVILYSLIFIVLGCATTGNVKDSAIPEESRIITAIELQDYSVTVKVNSPFSYTLYKSDDPYKIIVELLDVNTGGFNRKIVSDKLGITEIVPSQIEAPFMARLEILLQTPTTADPEYRDNELKIRIKEEPHKGVLTTEAAVAKEAMPELLEEPESAEPEKVLIQKATEITSVSFEKTSDIVKVLVKGNGSMNPSILPLENRIIIDVSGVDMKAQLPSEVVSPLKGIRSGKNDDKIRLVLDLHEKTDFDVTTIGDTIVVALSPEMAHKPEENLEVKENSPVTGSNYSGKKISLDFQDTDIVPIFRLLADISGYNIILSPEVKGKLTMKLLNVPWDQALDIILKTFSLGKVVENNIIRIAPHTAFAKENEEAAKAKESELKAVPLETRIFPISYADVKDIEKAIKDAKILSSRGSISVDKRTSAVAINDVVSVFSKIEDLLATLDKPTPQVLIEARIVEAFSSDVRSLGIQWGISTDGNNVVVGTTANQGPFTGNNFMVDLPSPEGAAGGIAFGILNSARTKGLELVISALETVGKSKTVSNPRVVTTDNEKATILQGESVPFPKIDVQSGQISAEYKDVAITIEVTPHITPTDSITMSVLVRKEDIKAFVPLGQGTQAPRTDKIEGNTKVLIQDGETLVIGGVFKKKLTDDSTGVPGFMKIPVLGWLFKNRRTSEETTELLIFITPRVLERTI
jgi:type IV pilus assembly protein PilQ